MALTGRAETAPLGPPAGLVPKLRAVAATLSTRAEALGGQVDVDPLALLGERAALTGLTRRGPTSCGGATRLLPCRDGWVAVSLARPDDVALLPAWLELSSPPGDEWEVIARAAASERGGELVGRARMLGLPAAALAGRSLSDGVTVPAGMSLPVLATQVRGSATPVTPLAETTVVELGALWAGPLCGALFAEAGAHVIKVESTSRPDGARQGPAAFFDLLNGRKHSLELDLRTPEGAFLLREVLARADVVVEASRPRALEQLGIDAQALLANGGPRAWVSITGHGRTGAAREWVAFGDDAAVAGGLVAWDDDGPVFCADAIADPTTGLIAATAAVDALARGGHWLLDVSMASVAAHLAGPTLPVAPHPVAAPPRARPAPGRAPRLGEHTDAVLAQLGVRP